MPDVHTKRPGNIHIKLDAKMPILNQQDINKITNALYENYYETQIVRLGMKYKF